MDQDLIIIIEFFQLVAGGGQSGHIQILHETFLFFSNLWSAAQLNSDQCRGEEVFIMIHSDHPDRAQACQQAPRVR